MIGKPDSKEDDKLAKKRLANTQALMSNNNLKVGNYEVQFDPSVPLANRQAFARTPTRPMVERPRVQQAYPVRTKSNSTLNIAPPKTMGDMLRYNRELKTQRIAADIENAKAKTGIDAFSAEQSAAHNMRSDANTARATGITGQHYNRADDIDAMRARDTGKHYADTNSIALKSLEETTKANKAKQALEASRTPSEIALREAQARGLSEQALSTAQEREANIPKNALEQEIITETQRLANVPGTSPDRLNALTRSIAKPASDYQNSLLKQKRFDNFTKFMAAFPPARQEEAEAKFYEYEKKFGGDQDKIQALIANPSEDDEDMDIDTYKQLLFQ